MTTKLISAVLFIFAVTVLVFRSNASDPIFLFVSNNLGVGIVRLLLVSLVLFISVKGYMANDAARTCLNILGIMLVAFGLASLADMNLGSMLYGYFKYLDFMLAIELGIAMSLLSMTTLKSPQETKAPSTTPYLLRAR